MLVLEHTEFHWYNISGISVVSKNAIRLLKNKKVRNIKPIVADISKIKLKNKFDIIYANLSLHYFGDKATTKIFLELYKMLNKGGYLFVRCKSADDPMYGKGKRLEDDYFIFQNHKRHFFSKSYMKEKLHKFRILSIKRTSSKHFRIGWSEYDASFIEAVAKK